MMFMTNKVFLDSSLLVEYIKGKKRRLLTELIADATVETFISETIISEFLFHYLHVTGKASPKSLHSSKKIKKLIDRPTIQSLLQRFSFLPTDTNLYRFVPSFMQTYNLLPNDAIILATCKIHGITKLASHDSDFVTPCKKEGIELLKEE